MFFAVLMLSGFMVRRRSPLQWLRPPRRQLGLSLPHEGLLRPGAKHAMTPADVASLQEGAERLKLGEAFREDPMGATSAELLQRAWAVLGPAMHHPHAAPEAVPTVPFALESPDWQALVQEGLRPTRPEAKIVVSTF